MRKRDVVVLSCLGLLSVACKGTETTDPSSVGTTTIRVDVDPRLIGTHLWSGTGDTTSVSGGAATTRVSSEGAQLLALTNDTGAAVALSLAVPTGTSATALPVDAYSTVIAQLFLTPGIATTVPAEATARIQAISQLNCFQPLESRLDQLLGTAPLHDLFQDPQIQSQFEACVSEFLATRDSGLVLLAPASYTTIQQAGAFQLTRSEAGGQVAVAFKNMGYRYVDVFRRDLALTGADLGTVSVRTLMSGARPASWGSLFTATVGQATEGTDNTLSSSRGDVFEYWVLGPGLGNTTPSASLPTSIQASNDAMYLSILSYAVLPLLNIASGSATLSGASGVPVDVLQLLWIGIKGGINANYLAQARAAGDKVSAQRALANLAAQMVALCLKSVGGAEAPIVAVHLMGAEAARWAGKFWVVLNGPFEGWNLGAFVTTIWNVPSAYRFYVSRLDPSALQVGLTTVSGFFGQPLASPIVAKVVDGQGSPVAGIPVRATVLSGGGRATVTSTALQDVNGDATTDGSGQVSVQWILGSSATSQQLKVEIPFAGSALPVTGSPTTVTATASAGQSSVVSLSTRISHACAVGADGTTRCWGSNGYGRLGNGTTTSSTTPVAASGGTSFTSIAVGNEHSCGLTSGGSAFCWGWNLYGELGTGSTIDSWVPVAVSGGLTFRSLVAGNEYTCALTNIGAAYCWGNNSSGQLGGSTATYSAAPVAVSGGQTFVSLAAGDYHVCGITGAGVAYCWGSNLHGELGNGSAFGSTSPVAVSGGRTFVALAAGEYVTCGISVGGASYCWGYNSSGQLGNGSTTSSTTPVLVSGSTIFVSLGAGDGLTCGRTSSGSVYCWGSNSYGQLGNSTTVASSSPVAVSGGLTFTSIAVGETSVCGRASSGTAYCWGYNGSGQLGNGSTTNSSLPVSVSGPSVAPTPPRFVAGILRGLEEGGP